MARNAEDAQLFTTRLSEISDNLLRLEQEAAALQDQLLARQNQLSHLVGVFLRLSRLPSWVVFGLGLSFDESVQSLILLRSIVPELTSQAEQLQKLLEQQKKYQQQITLEKEALTEAKEKLAQKQKALEKTVATKKDVLKTIEVNKTLAARKAQAIAAKAKDLQELLSQLAATKKPNFSSQTRLGQKQRAIDQALAVPDPKSQKGKMLLPAAGKLIQNYGQKDEWGASSKGMLWEVAPGAQIVAPLDGEIAYAGPFRSYGQLVLIAHKKGYHTLLAGLDEITAEVGQIVLTGEPVGKIDKKTGAKSAKKPMLYIELRKDGRPINPQPWFLPKK